jgi:hypothetical protein
MGLGTKVRSISSDIKDRATDARMDSLSRENDELKVENELLRDELDGDRKTRDRMMGLLDRLDVEARPKRRIGLVRVLVIGAAAYVLGAKAGRERYEQIRAWWKQAKNRTTEATQSWSNGSSGSMGSELEHQVSQGI